MKRNSYVNKKTYVVIFIIVFFIVVVAGFFYLSRKQISNNENNLVASTKKDTHHIVRADTLTWKAPDESDIPALLRLPAATLPLHFATLKRFLICEHKCKSFLCGTIMI